MSTNFRRRLGLLLLAVGLSMSMQIVRPAISSAHSVLLSSNPSDGQVLSTAPASITLVFTESVDPAMTVIDLVDLRGLRFHPRAVHLAHETNIVADLPRLPDQTYRVSWRTVSADDRHSTSGVVVFGVGARPNITASLPADPLPAPGEVLVRWTLLVSLGGLIGGLLLARSGRWIRQLPHLVGWF